MRIGLFHYELVINVKENVDVSFLRNIKKKKKMNYKTDLFINGLAMFQ